MFEKELHTCICKRIHYLQGQLKGIEKMLDSGRSACDILIQLQAVEGGIRKMIYEVFEEYLRKEIALLINILRQRECLDEPSCRRIDFIKKEFQNRPLNMLAADVDALRKMQKVQVQ